MVTGEDIFYDNDERFLDESFYSDSSLFFHTIFSDVEVNNPTQSFVEIADMEFTLNFAKDSRYLYIATFRHGVEVAGGESPLGQGSLVQLVSPDVTLGLGTILTQRGEYPFPPLYGPARTVTVFTILELDAGEYTFKMQHATRNDPSNSFVKQRRISIIDLARI